MAKFGDEYKNPHTKIIVREDYRLYYYMIDPVSRGHQAHIATAHRKVEDFFKDRDIAATREIQTTANGKRMIWIRFADLQDANLFYFTLIEHITTKGNKFD